MRLSNHNGDFFGIEISGYQFPAIVDDQWDSNWLIIKGQVSLNGRSWKFQDPCLLTWEVRRLAEWLRLRATGETTKTNLGFVEPNLEIDCPSHQAVRIFFELEARPEWAPCDGAGMMDLFFEMTNDAKQLNVASENLVAQLAKFPIRGEPIETY